MQKQNRQSRRLRPQALPRIVSRAYNEWRRSSVLPLAQKLRKERRRNVGFSSLILKPVSLSFVRAFVISVLLMILASYIILKIRNVPITFNFMVMAFLLTVLSSSTIWSACYSHFEVHR